MLVLNSMNGSRPFDRRARIGLFQKLGDRLERLADRKRQSGETNIAEGNQTYANSLSEMAA